MTPSVQLNQERSCIVGCLKTVFCPVIYLANKVDQLIAGVMAYIGNRYNWEGGKWAGYKVELNDGLKGNLKFDDLKPMFNLPERGGYFYATSVNQFQPPATRIAYLIAYLTEIDRPAPRVTEEQPLVVEPRVNLDTLMRLEAHIRLEERTPLPKTPTRSFVVNRVIFFCKKLAIDRCNEAIRTCRVQFIDPLKNDGDKYNALLKLLGTLREQTKLGYVTTQDIHAIIEPEDRNMSLKVLHNMSKAQIMISSYWLLKCGIECGLWDEENVIVRYYTALAKFYARENTAVDDLTVAEEFLKSLTDGGWGKDIISSNEWLGIQEPSEVKDYIKKTLLGNGESRTYGYSSDADLSWQNSTRTGKYLENVGRGIQCGFIRLPHSKDSIAVGYRTYLCAAASDFKKDLGLLAPSEAFAILIKHLEKGLEFDVMDRNANRLLMLAKDCLKGGVPADNWRETTEGRALTEWLEEIVVDARLLPQYSRIWPSA